MEKRIQRINGDTVLEITSQKAVKERLSENDLVRRKEYLEESIAVFQTELDAVNISLSQIYAESIKS